MASNSDLKSLATSTRRNNRVTAARNPRIANVNFGQLLRNLAKNQHYVVREAAASNPRTANVNGGKLLRNLAKNQDNYVRRAITPLATLADARATHPVCCAPPYPAAHGTTYRPRPTGPYPPTETTAHPPASPHPPHLPIDTC